MRFPSRLRRVTSCGLAVSALAGVVLSGCMRNPQPPPTAAGPEPVPVNAVVQQQVQEAAVKAGDLVFTTGFENDAERAVWSTAPGVTWAQPGCDSGTCLAVDAPESVQKGALMVEMPFDLTLRLDQESQAHGVARTSGEQANGEGAGVPQRVQQARS